MRFNHPQFFAGYRAQFGSLKQDQVNGLESLLTAIESDPYITDVRWAGYELATTKHETADTFRPIHEYGSRQYFISHYGGQTPLGRRLGNDTPEEGAIYAGEGDVQLTGEANYERAEKEVREQYPQVVAEFEARTGKKFDLTVGDQPGDEADPQNAADPVIAYCIMSAGMRQGWFTGKTLGEYFNATITDPLHARRIINGMDRAEIIAQHYYKFVQILKDSSV